MANVVVNGKVTVAMSGLTVVPIVVGGAELRSPTVCHYDWRSDSSKDWMVGWFSEPLVIVGQTDEDEDVSGIRQTDDHKNKFKYQSQ